MTRRFSTKTVLLIALGCLSAGGLTAVAVAAVGGDSSDGPPAPTIVGTATEVPPGPGPTPPASLDPTLISHFAVFRRPADAVAPNSAAIARPEALQQLGVNLELARQVPGGRGPITVAPAAGAICVSSVTSSACPSIEEALAGRGTAVELCSPSVPAGTVRLYGLLPDGASSVQVILRSGARLAVSLTDGVYVAETRGIPDRLAWNVSGAPQESSLPVPSDAQAEVNACRQ
jgi:hypothetical protein